MPRLAVGQTIHVRPLADSQDEIFESRVIEFSEEFLYIDIPIHSSTRQEMEADVGQYLRLEYRDKDGSLNRYVSSILEVASIPVLAWKIVTPELSHVDREQRREYVRVSVDIPLNIEVREGLQVKKVSVYTRDMSGGGLSFAAPRTLSLLPGEATQLKFVLPGNNFPVDVKGRVNRVSDPNDRGFAVVSLNYEGMKESVRQRVIQFIFTRQRMMR